MKQQQVEELARFYLAASEAGQRAIMAFAKGEARRQAERDAALAREREKKRQKIGLVVVSSRALAGTGTEVRELVTNEIKNHRASGSR